MPASAVSSPTAATRTRIADPTATVPATTCSPSSFATGFDSPVTIDSSISARPSSIRPSAGIRAPGRTSTRSPRASAPVGTVSTPSAVTRSASSGSSSASAASAPRACPIAFISCQCPSSMIAISVASSHHSSMPTRSTSEATLATNATVIASEISSIIPGRRCRSSSRPPARNTRPP